MKDLLNQIDEEKNKVKELLTQLQNKEKSYNDLYNEYDKLREMCIVNKIENNSILSYV